MTNITESILYSNIEADYRKLDRRVRRDTVLRENLSISFDPDISLEEKLLEVSRLQGLGYVPVSLRYILGGISVAGGGARFSNSLS